MPKFFEEVKICKVCGVECAIHKKSIVCTPCRTKLRSEGRVWCRTCDAIGESWTKRYNSVCWTCYRIRELPKERLYNAQRKAQGYRRTFITQPIKSQTNEERDVISRMLDRGMATRQIARVLNISRARVRSTILHGAGQAAGSKQHTGTMTPVLTSKQLELIFRHVSTNVLIAWRRYGFPMQPYGLAVSEKDRRRGHVVAAPKKHDDRAIMMHDASSDSYRVQLYYIKDKELEKWMADCMSWMLWSIDDVIDPFWRAFAVSVRTTTGRWMTVKEAAPYLGIQPGTLKRRIRDCSYTGRWCNRVGKIWLWSEDIVDHALYCDGRVITVP